MALSLFLRLPSFGETFPIGNPITIIQTANICPLHVMSRQEVLPSRNSSSLRIRTSFLAGGREGELAKKLVLILNMLLFLPGNTSSLVTSLPLTSISPSSLKPGPLGNTPKGLELTKSGVLAYIM